MFIKLLNLFRICAENIALSFHFQQFKFKWDFCCKMIQLYFSFQTYIIFLHTSFLPTDTFCHRNWYLFYSIIVEALRAFMQPSKHTCFHNCFIFETLSSKRLFEVFKEMDIARRNVWSVGRMFQYFPSHCFQFCSRGINHVRFRVVMQRNYISDRLRFLFSSKSQFCSIQ